MKQVWTLLCFLLLGSSLLAQGTIRGKISDELGLGLPGATVSINSLMKGAFADVNGDYILVDIPAGTHTVEVSYIGYATVSSEVTVADGETAVLNLSMEPGAILGEEVLVLGDRLKGQAKALNQQKSNINVTNIVAADQIGRFPDANIGDAVKRIPGITIQGDQGEARNVIIRGLAPQLNSVMINGERIPSAEGDNRNIQMDLIPSDMVQTVEVNKAVTPDMDADAIGGSVNLVTRAAPTGFRVSGTASSGLNFLSNQPIWNGSLIVGTRFADDKIGLIVSGNYNNHDFGSDNIEAEWTDEAEGFDGEDTPFVYADEIQIRTYLVQRVRRSIAANLDFKLNENNTIYLQGMYNWRDDWENRYRTVYKDIAPIFDENNTVTGYQGAIERQSKGGGTIYDDRVRDRRLEDQRVANLTLRGDHLFGKAKVDWNVTYARASEERLFERYMQFATDGEETPLTYDISDPMFPFVAASPALTPDAFELDELTEETQFTSETDLNGRIDLSLPVYLGNNRGDVQAGFRVRTKEKDRANNFFEYSPVSGIETLADVTFEDFSKDDFLAGDQYDAGIYASPEYLGALDLADDKLFEEEDKPDEYLADNYVANENIIGGYAMWNQQLSSKLTALVGVRVENTNISYTGNIIEDEEVLIREETQEDNYLNILPGAHLKFNATDNFIVRAAWTNTLARPNYFDLVPFQSIVGEDEVIARGNPELVPTTAMNFDLNAENYFQSIGLVSAGVFYKDIDNFIYTFVDENFVDEAITGGNEWTLFEPRNGGAASLFGAEIAFQRQLDFLPGALKGFGVYLNYTYTTSNAEGIRNEDGELREGIALPGTAPHLVNASLSYENKALVLRASLNYAHDYIDEVGSSDFSDRFYDRQLFVDLNGSYAFTPNFRFFFEINNLTNQPLRYYQGIRERTMQLEYYNMRLNAGVKFDLFRK